LLFLGAVCAYVVTAGTGRIVLPGKAGRRYSVAVTSWFSGIGLKLLGIVPSYVGNAGDLVPRGCLLVANHLSYVDAMVISSRFPSVFVTSEEVRRTPFLGTMSALGGSAFVDRRGRSTVKRDIGRMAELLRAGHTVCLFPEATSSDGTDVLPFRSSLFQAAVEASAGVVPVYIRYERAVGANGRPVAPESVCYYGDKRFWAHLVGLLRLRHVSATVGVLGEVEAERLGRKGAAEASYRGIRECVMVRPGPVGRVPVAGV
jgi:1-acyl-sn-glycerol-3-phosphate acyltransferase